MINKLPGDAKGFTLIELMIAMVIVGILAAIAIPRFMSANTKAKQAEAQQILKQIFEMQNVYHAEHDCYACDGETMCEA